MGGGRGVVFELGNPEGRGGVLKQFWKSRWKGGGSKNMPSIRGGGGVDFFWTHSTFFSFTYVSKEMVNSSMCHIG